MNLFKTVSCVSLVALLAACNSTSDSGQGGINGGPLPPEFTDLAALVTRSDAATEVTDPTDLDGTATMTGFIGATFVTGDEAAGVEESVLGTMTVTANFGAATPTITGTGTDFRQYRSSCPETGCGDGDVEISRSLVGNLVFAGDITGASFDGTLGGTLTGDFDEDGATGSLSSAVNMTVDSGTGGFLREADGNLMAGADLTGTSTTTFTRDDGTDVDPEFLILEGGFLVAE